MKQRVSLGVPSPVCLGQRYAVALLPSPGRHGQMGTLTKYVGTTAAYQASFTIYRAGATSFQTTLVGDVPVATVLGTATWVETLDSFRGSDPITSAVVTVETKDCSTTSPSATATATTSPSATETPTVSPSVTPSTTPSTTESPSATVTPTVTPTATDSASVTPTVTPSTCFDPITGSPTPCSRLGIHVLAAREVAALELGDLVSVEVGARATIPGH